MDDGKNDIIDKVFVITTNLHGLPMDPFIFISHSALLIQTKTNRLFILEYGVKSQSVVRLREIIGLSCIRGGKFTFNGETWKVRNRGKRSPRDVTVGEMEQTMIAFSSQEPYTLHHWNCHAMQYMTQKLLKFK